MLKKQVFKRSSEGGDGELMKHATSFSVKKYAEISGDKKVRIALDLSKRVRKLIASGFLNPKTNNERERYLYSLDELAKNPKFSHYF